jgi:FixJ family two-component response regulator
VSPAPSDRGTPTVFIVDDEPAILRAAIAILSPAGYTVETFENAEAALFRLRATDRGCMVLESELPGMGGLALQKALSERGVTMPVIFISRTADVPVVVKAMKQGAMDFLIKPVAPSTLLDGVASAMLKDEDGSGVRADAERARERWSKLSPREQHVSELVARGMLIKQVAREFGTTESTTQAQRANALKKLGVSSVVDLVHVLELVRQSSSRSPGGGHRI